MSFLFSQSMKMYFWRLIEKRSPKSNQHQLGHKNIYVFPTARGFVFLFLTMILWLIGTNYQNNLILAMMFLLISIFVVSIYHTFHNISRLKVQYHGCDDVFAGGEAYFSFAVSSGKSRWSNGLIFSWYKTLKKLKSTQEKESAVIDVPFEDEQTIVIVPLVTSSRGELRPKRMLVESYFPLGIIRCWSWLTWDVSTIVYPAPKQHSRIPTIVADDLGDGLHPTRGGEDFSGLKDYQPGDTIKHIAWKVYARGKGLYKKEFDQNVSTEHWLVFDSLDGLTTEERLSDMCFWALFFSQKDDVFGVKLNGKTIPPNKGDDHLRHVLHALACF